MLREVIERTRRIAELVALRRQAREAWELAEGEEKHDLWQQWQVLTCRIQQAQDMSRVVDSQARLFEATI
jgi:hypothetical protein